VADFRRHADFRCITMYLQRVMLDKLIDNDTPVTERLSNDFVARHESDISQEALKSYFDEVLQTVENHHHAAMSRFAWREGEPASSNGLSFPDPGPTEKKDDAAKPQRKKKDKPPTEGSPA
jgi:hypothetical protein